MERAETRDAAQPAASDAAGILFVPSPVRQRPHVAERLLRSGSAVTIAADLADALQLLARKRYAFGLLDLADERGALGVTRVLRTQYPQLPLVGLVEPNNSLVAGEALHVGIADLLPWPFEERDLTALLVNARDRMTADIQLPVTASGQVPVYAQSMAMRHAVDLTRAAAASRDAVCFVGETGSGRELLARGLHDQAPQGGDRRPPFVMVDCGEGAPAEVERRLFGAAAPEAGVRGSGLERLGAASAFVEACGGTMLLANLSEASARVQLRLARLLRDREAQVERRGLTDLDVRTVASFAPDVDAAVSDGRLRRDLYDRLSAIRIEVPPLRRRKEDVPLLAVSFLHAAAGDAAPKTLSRSALALLSALPWPGNGDDLRAFVETLVRSVRKPVIQIDDLLEHASLDGLSARLDPGLSLRDAKARFERDCITAVLMRHHGRVGEAAKALGIQRTNLYRKVRQLNVARSLLSARR